MGEASWSLVAEGCVLVGAGLLLVRRGRGDDRVLLLCVAASTLVTVGAAL